MAQECRPQRGSRRHRRLSRPVQRRCRSLDELAAQLLAARGSTLEDERERKRCAVPFCVPPWNSKRPSLPIRFEAYAEGGPVLIALSAGACGVRPPPWPRARMAWRRGSAAQPRAGRR